MYGPTRGHALAFAGQAGEGLSEIEETLGWARTADHPAVEAECLWRRAEALAALAGGTPLTRHEAQWAHAEFLASRGGHAACRATATTALDQAQDDGYLILVPRLRELTDR